ncbi:GNAT family N-acetyltransferase [Microbacterium amylolyticum]|uniref:GNAT family acetyltransferase n=1 Tax=Microbacterium amylolyticum TaxID=936337 RepID=A0ABS4ZH40_9MICO|nr:GNAT family N-acetyltransferase [Microbacterium amylolyticum]MBP2436305.1 putative GNAT family acetyltransferase [Microbacterium amylolyticum]
MTDLIFTDAPDSSRYELRAEGELVAALEYQVSGEAVSLTRTYTSPEHRGKGYAGIITERAVDAIEAAGGLTIVPMCSYVAGWFEKNPERANVLE